MKFKNNTNGFVRKHVPTSPTEAEQQELLERRSELCSTVMAGEKAYLSTCDFLIEDAKRRVADEKVRLDRLLQRKADAPSIIREQEGIKERTDRQLLQFTPKFNNAKEKLEKLRNQIKQLKIDLDLM